MLALQPREPPLAGAGAQVQRHHRGGRRARRGDAREERVDGLVVVAEVGDHRGDHDVARESGVGDRPDEVQPRPRGRTSPVRAAGAAPRPRWRSRRRSRRARRARPRSAAAGRAAAIVPLVRIENGVPDAGERVDDPGHQPVAALGALVGVGVRAQGDRSCAQLGRRSSRRSTSATLILTTIWLSKSAPASRSR